MKSFCSSWIAIWAWNWLLEFRLKNFRCFSCNSSVTIQMFQFNCKKKATIQSRLIIISIFLDCWHLLCHPPTNLAKSEGYPIKHVFLDFLSSHPFPWQEGYGYSLFYCLNEMLTSSLIGEKLLTFSLICEKLLTFHWYVKWCFSISFKMGFSPSSENMTKCCVVFHHVVKIFVYYYVFLRYSFSHALGSCQSLMVNSVVSMQQEH